MARSTTLAERTAARKAARENGRPKEIPVPEFDEDDDPAEGLPRQAQPLDETSAEILDGGHDASLDELMDAIRQRRRALRAQEVLEAQATLRAGMTIKVKDDASISPKWLTGFKIGELRQIKGTRGYVEVERHILAQMNARRTRRFANPVGFPLDCIEEAD